MKNGDTENAIELDPKELAEKLGPFSPPEDFSTEPEFASPVPRPIPKHLKSGPHERSERQLLITLFLVGLFCLVASNLGLVRNLAYYILFLRYLDWLGIALIVISVVAAIHHFGFAGRYAYVKKGRAFPARILEVGHYAGGTEEAPMFGFCALVEFEHPETGEMQYSVVRSPRKFDARQAHRFSTNFEPGDYVTAVCLPEKGDSSLQLYGFLDLSPDLNLILKDGERMVPSVSAEKVIAALLGIVGVIAFLVFALYSVEFRFPLEYDSSGFVAGIAGGALFFGVITFFLSSRVRSMRKERKKWIFVGFGLGGIFPLFLLPVVNAGLDRSDPRFREVEVVEFWQETWYPVFIRNYQIEYRELESGRTDKYPATVTHMEMFTATMAGAIEMKEGFFGWSWIRQIHPVVVVISGTADDQETFPGRPIAVGQGDYEGTKLSLAVLRDGDEYHAVSEELAERVRSTLELEPREWRPSDESSVPQGMSNETGEPHADGASD